MIGYDDKRKQIGNDDYLFSVTQMNEFINNPNHFFRKVILKEDIPFANNATALGTIIHYAISQAHNDSEIHDFEINEYLDSLSEFDIDYRWILNKFSQMKNIVVPFAKNFSIDKPNEFEKAHLLKLDEHIYLGGTLDCRYDNTIIDYKTTNKLTITKDDELPEKYINQLYTYAYMLHQEGIAVDKAAIMYMTIPEVGRISEKTGKPMKDYPCRCFVVEKYLQQEKMDEIIKKIELIKETIKLILNDRKLLPYFARDLELK
jgi:ATP-dependent helicase/DNAse subunit B